VERKAGEVLDEVRYLAIRVRRRQGVLFEDGVLTKHFAVVTNRFDFDAKRLLEWHREKAGSIEALHHVLKNELAAGVMPCARFGANAAWLRLAVMTHNVLTGLKRIALKPEYLRARPKRLRFQIFCSLGTLVHHARQLREWVEAWALLPSTGEREALTDGLSDPILKCPQPEVCSKVHPGALAIQSTVQQPKLHRATSGTLPGSAFARFLPGRSTHPARYRRITGESLSTKMRKKTRMLE
jgi:hypothetical protein